MPRRISSIAPDWWDYTTLDSEIIKDAAALTPEKMLKLSRPGFKVVFYDTLTLDHSGQENTAVRFHVADNGKVTDISHRAKSLIQLTRAVRRPG